jgi:CHAT domain-containing protein/Tfp pilus assembly protein PilF
MRLVLVSCAALVITAASARAQLGEFLSLPAPGPSPAPARAQSLLPVATAEGNEALARLLEICRVAGGIVVAEDPGSHSRSYVLRDAEKVRAAVAANPRLLTPALRDAAVARWNSAYQVPARRVRPGGFPGFGEALASAIGGIEEPIPRVDEDQQRLGVVLLQALGDVTADDCARAFAAFLTGQGEERRGDDAAALRAYERARQLFVLVKDPAWEAGCLNNLGTVDSEQGEYVRALDHFQQAVTLGTQARGANDPLVATFLENMGEVYARQDDDPQAEACLQKALAIWSKAPGEHRPRMATALVRLGDVYARQGKDDALTQLERALAIWQKLLGENRPGASDRIAMINSDPGFDMDKALGDLQALSTLHKIYGNDVSPIAATLDRIGDVYAGRTQFDEALDQYRRALEIRRRLLGDDHPGLAQDLHNIGSVHLRQGKLAEARDDLRAAVLASRQGPAPADLGALEAGDLRPLPLTAEVLHDYGRLLERELGETPTVAQLRACARVYRLAADVLERMRREVLQAEASKVVLGAERFDLFSRHIGICRRLFAVEGQAGDLETAFTLAEQGSARVFLEQMSKSRAESIGGVSEDLRRQEMALDARLGALDARIAREQDRPLNQRDASRLTGLFEERRQAEAQRLQLVARMEREYPRYAALMYPRPCSLEEARACLGPNEVALLYVLGSEESFVVLLGREDAASDRAHGLAVYPLPPAEAIAAQVEGLTDAEVLGQPARVAALGADAYDLLLAPLAEAIKGKDLLILPSGPLYALPFGLLGERTAEPGRRFLVEGHRIRYTPSLTILSVVRQWDTTRTRPDRLLAAVGDPVYEASDERVRGGADLDRSSREAREEYLGRMRGARDAAGLRFDRLAFSGRELQEIARIMGTSPDDTLTGLRASEAVIKAASEAGLLARNRYVHFATHGILGLDVGRQPSLVLSLVGNDGREQGGGRNDGFLQMDEVTHLRLDADLVVLSACQSGRGRLRNGEGVSSLTRSFLYAGSRGVVCSLWQVADRETSEMMGGLYAGLKAGKPATDALRDAQLGMIAAGEPPLYWAPFVLVGQ